MKHLILMCFLIASNLGVQAQNTVPGTGVDSTRKPDLAPAPLNVSDWSGIINRSFGRLVGASGSSTLIGNYASFDPLGGSFTFKGSAAIGKKNSQKLGYLSIAANGDLISDSYAALFTNSKLNTNAGIQLEYNFRLRRSTFAVYHRQQARYQLDTWALQDSIAKAKAQYRTEISAIPYKLELLKFQIGVAQNDIARQDSQIKNIRAVIRNQQPAPILKPEVRKILIDSLLKLDKSLQALNKQVDIMQFKQDSLNQIRNLETGLTDFNDVKQDSVYASKSNGLKQRLQLADISFNWFTLIIGGGRKTYFTFDPAQSFGAQLQPEELGTYRFGLAFNSYIKNNFLNKIWYYNIGFYRERTNNTALLSTTELAQTSSIKNTAGDTLRTVSKKYNVYTDVIDNYRQWVAYGNLFYLFGEQTSGLHFFPSLYVPDNGKGFLNLGFGYIFSFINEKKDAPVINFEAYFQFNNLINSTRINSRFLDRNEIGIRFTLPFNFH